MSAIGEAPDVEFTKRWSDRMAYYGRASKILGAIQLVAGLLSMGLGVGSICTIASGYDIGYGIWCGFVFSLTGILAICTNYHKKVGMITATMVFCVLSAACGCIQFCIGVVATVNDRDRSSTGELSREKTYLDYDIYYTRNDPFNYLYSRTCTDPYGAFTWSRSWAPVDILLLLTGMLECFVAIASAALCCQSICCGLRRVYTLTKGVYVTGTPAQLPGYQGYAESRISEPTILKVVSD